MALNASPLALLRSAAARTRDEGSASLIVEFTGFELPGAGETVMEAGRIDFNSGMTELGVGGFGSHDEELFFRRDRQWRGPAEMPVGPLTAGSPPWLVEVTQGAINACYTGERWNRDVHVTCYTTVIDLVAAAEYSPYALASPGGFSLAELRRIPGSVMLDAKGRLRVVDVELAGLKAKLTLEDFGQPGDISRLGWPERVASQPDL
jgi:hypothetical protein